MKLLVKLKTGEEGLVVGYGPGRKGTPVAIVAVDGKIRPVKLRTLKLVGWAKLRDTAPAFMDKGEFASEAVH